MPRLRMPLEQQAIFDELAEFTGGARMINVPDLARFWGKDKRVVREWVSENGLPRYQMKHGYAYMIRDVSRAIWACQQAG